MFLHSTVCVIMFRGRLTVCFCFRLVLHGCLVSNSGAVFACSMVNRCASLKLLHGSKRDKCQIVALTRCEIRLHWAGDAPIQPTSYKPQTKLTTDLQPWQPRMSVLTPCVRLTWPKTIFTALLWNLTVCSPHHFSWQVPMGRRRKGTPGRKGQPSRSPSFCR